MNLSPHQSQQEVRETKQAHTWDSVIFEVACAALILCCEQEQYLCFQYLTHFSSKILQAKHFWGVFRVLDISLPRKCNNPWEMSEVTLCYAVLKLDMAYTVWKFGNKEGRIRESEGIRLILPSFHEKHTDHMLNLAMAVNSNAVKLSSAACRARDETGFEHFRYFHYIVLSESITTFSLYYHNCRKRNLCFMYDKWVNTWQSGKTLLLRTHHCGSTNREGEVAGKYRNDEYWASIVLYRYWLLFW